MKERRTSSSGARGWKILAGWIAGVVVIAFSSIAATSGHAAGTGDWSMFRHDAQHTGRSPFAGPDVPALKWRVGGDYAVQSSPVIGPDGTIYAIRVEGYALTGVLVALTPEGQEKWRISPYPGWVLETTPAVATDGTVYFVIYGDSYDPWYYSYATLCAASPRGTILWKKVIGYSPSTSITVAPNGTIYVGGNEWTFYGDPYGALAAVLPDGQLKWKVGIGAWTYVNTSPAVSAGGTIYVAHSGGIRALNSNGQELWSFLATIEYSTPALGADGTIYVGTAKQGPGNQILAINSNGTKKWSCDVGGVVNSSPAIASDGTIYVGCNDGNVYALSPNGTVQWSFTTGGPVSSSPAIGGDGTIYVGSGDHKTYAINRDGTKKWEFETENAVVSSPAIGSDGTLYFGSDDYFLYALEPGTTTAETSVSITDVSVKEGNSGSVNAVFNVTLSSPSGQTITADYATADGTATAGSDYVATTGTLTFNPGETSKTITVAISGDLLNEPDETFMVTLSNLANATVADGQGTGTITNDDNVHDVALTSLTASPNPASKGQTVTFSYIVKNNGTVRERNLTFKLSYNGTALGTTQTVGSLMAGQQTTKTMTVKVPRRQKSGDYLITGTVSTVSGETNTSNNSATVKVTVK